MMQVNDRVITVTEHALERYAVRFMGIFPEDVKDWLSENRESATTQLTEIVTSAREVYRGKVGEDGEVKIILFYDVWILVVATATAGNTKDRLVTIFQKDLGVNSTELTLLWLGEVEEKFKRLVERRSLAARKRDQDQKRLSREIDATTDRMNQLCAKYEAAEKYRDSLIAERAEAATEAYNIDTEIRTFAARLLKQKLI